MVQTLSILNSDLKVDLRNAQTVATACCFFQNVFRSWSEIRKAVTPVTPNGYFNGVGAIPAQWGVVHLF